MGKREPTQLTRLLRAAGLAFAIAVLCNGRVLTLWSSSLGDPTMRSLFSGVVGPVVRLSSAHGLDRPEARMRDAFKLALAGSSDGSSERIGPGAAAPEEGGTEPPPPLPRPSSRPDGTVDASDSVYYADYYRSFSFGSGAAGGKKPKGLRNVLFIGDSLLGSMAGSLKRSAPARPAYAIQLEYGISSALVQSVYCDWQKRLEDLLAGTAYDSIVVFLGANDGIGIHAGGRDLAFDSDEWVREYQSRVRALLSAMEGKAGRVYWLGTPPMRKAGYRERMARVNELVAEVCAEFPRAEHVDLAPLLGDSRGRYRPAMYMDGEMRIVRADDGIHFTEAGARLITDFVFGLLDQETAEASRPRGMIGP